MSLLSLDGWSLEWDTAEAALEGESGDSCLIQPFHEGALIAVIDGLGHGPEAAHAGRVAASTLEHYAGERLEHAFTLCHEAVRGTRGVVMTLVSFSAVEGTLTWCGVGNVEALLLRADPQATPRREAVTPRGGVVGYQLPPLHVRSVAVSEGDTLVMVTDGIRSGFDEEILLYEAPADVAGRVLRTHARGTDDALVMVVKFLRGEHGH